MQEKSWNLVTRKNIIQVIGELLDLSGTQTNVPTALSAGSLAQTHQFLLKMANLLASTWTIAKAVAFAQRSVLSNALR